MSYETLSEEKQSWARQCALAIQTRREKVNTERNKARGADEATRDRILQDLQPTLDDLNHYYEELKSMGLNETEIEQLIQLL